MDGYVCVSNSSTKKRYNECQDEAICEFGHIFKGKGVLGGRAGRGGAAAASHVAQDKQRSLPGGSLSPRQEYDLGGVISLSIYYGQILARPSDGWGGGAVRPLLTPGNLGSI